MKLRPLSPRSSEFRLDRKAKCEEMKIPENGAFCSKRPSNHGGWGCGADKGFLYTVALQKEIVQVLEHILAPEYQPGDCTGLRTPGGGAESVYVLSTNAQQWCALWMCCTTRLTSFPPALGGGLKLSNPPLLACLTAKIVPSQRTLSVTGLQIPRGRSSGDSSSLVSSRENNLFPL